MRELSCQGVFGKWLRDAMVDRDVSERELAQAIGVHHVTVSYHLNGKRHPTLPMLKKYAKYFGVDWSELYEMTLS